MKISMEKRNKNAAKRTMKSFSDALIKLLEQNKLEQITIAMLCEESTYPRSTFYNYFEDIFDLIDYIMAELFRQISLDDFQSIDPQIRSLTLFEKAYDVLKKYHIVIEKITDKNDYNGSFMERVRNNIRSTISYIIFHSECIAKFPVSNVIMQYHYSNTLELVLEQCFMTSTPITKEEALETLDFLLGTLEREAKKNGRTD